MDYIMDTLAGLAKSSGFASLYWGNWVMILVALFFLYLAIAKGYEPLLLVPIAFGMLLVNMYPQIAAEPSITYEYYSDANSVNEDKYLTIKVSKSGEYTIMYKDPENKDGELKELEHIEAYYNSATHEYLKIEENDIDVIDAGYIKCVFAFKDKSKVAFGIGTYIANDTDVPSLNIVMKVTECNNRPVAKLSNAGGKTMCEDDEYVEYLKKSIEWRLAHTHHK